MRILLVASTAHPESVGEAQISYQWASRLAARHEVTVLCYRQRDGLPLTGTIPQARIVEWDEPPLVGRHERIKAMLNPGYAPFYWHAKHWLRRALARGESFDVAHQVAPVSLRYPSPLASSSIPYVLGPVGGSLPSPEAFRAEEAGAPWYMELRALDRHLLRHWPALRRSFSNASTVIGIADYVRELLDDIPVQEFRTMSDSGITDLPPAAVGSSRTEAVRLLFVGRVIRTKGVRDIIRAIESLPHGLVSLDVVGDGYDRAACGKIAADLGVADLVRFHGLVAHEHVARFYDRADIFVFPSYREAGGIAVVEAMSHGLPVIVADRGGPATSVGEDGGLRIPVLHPDQYAADLAAAIRTLAGDPMRRASLGNAARTRVASTALWDRRIEEMEQIYERVRAGNRAAIRPGARATISPTTPGLSRRSRSR